MAPPGLLETFLAAIQASLSALLVIFYGGIAAKLKILSKENTRAISKACVQLFLPALLITQIGSELHAGLADRYLMVFLWAGFCHVVSYLVGTFARRVLGLPDWVTVAVMFNNTTSYPLLLIQALDETGILRSLVTVGEPTKVAIERAKSYFLVFATVSNCLTFAIGPRLIDPSHGMELPDSPKSTRAGGFGQAQHHEDGATEETALLGPQPGPVSYNGLLPRERPTASGSADRRVSFRVRVSSASKRVWNGLGPGLKWWLLVAADFCNATLLGAVIGGIIGLSPPLHRAFFSKTHDGGIFTAWLTSSLKSIGSLFVPLPVVVAGVSLYSSMGAASGSHGTRARMPWIAGFFVLSVRFIFWPILSITSIWLLVSRTDVLAGDPMLWFVMMLMPTGPPAMKLITLIQVSDGGEGDETNMAKLLTMSYLISPILSFTVVGSLMASQACIGDKV